VYLKHANALDLVSVLTDVASSSSSNPDGVQSDFSVQADESTNSLIVKASPAEFISIKNIIDKLDIRRAQVYVEAVIANVSTDQFESFGLNWDGGDPIASSNATVAGLTGNNISNLDLSAGDQKRH